MTGPTLRVGTSRGMAGSRTRRGEPVTVGAPWPRGWLRDAGEIRLLDSKGVLRPLQARVLDRWSDGSVRWCLLDWLADVDGETTYQIETGEPRVPPVAAPALRIARAGDRLLISTGRLDLEIDRENPASPFTGISTAGSPLLDPAGTDLVARLANGVPARPRWFELALEEEGPIRAGLRLSGDLEDDSGKALAAIVLRLHLWVSSATVRCELTVRNPRAAGHPGGRWSLGSTGSIYLEELRLRMQLSDPAGSSTAACSPETDVPAVPLELPALLHQDSSGGPNWRGRNHWNRQRVVPLAFRGYRLRHGETVEEGRRATPIVTLESGEAFLGLAVRHFWQNFPKAIEVEEGAITYGLFPRHHADVHELQGGEQKTHVFHLALARDTVSPTPLEWCRSPLMAGCDPEWYALAEALPYLTPRDRDPNSTYRRLVDLAIDGDDSFENKREAVDEYGWRHFGDLWADHEEVFYEGPTPILSHYNNQYDAVQGFAIQFFRSGDERWFRLLDDLARHVVDIDIYHTDRDKAAYNHGLFWHTLHYVDADLSTHRSFPPLRGVAGGGPSGGHLYTTGLMLHHFLTGCPRSREAVLELGRYVIDADDGSRTRFRFLDRGPTGHVSSSGFDDFHGPGRTPANAVGALLDAHRLCGARAFLDKAEELIRRCIHPDDDLEALNLRDAERRWYYTMFLQALGRYLEHKEQLGERDTCYAYARAALLSYADWIEEHESPFLDRAEELEFPTETWAAQDLRKSEVLQLSALHAGGDRRSRYLRRGREFFDYAVETLDAAPTRGLCRPLVLLLSHGHTQAWFDGSDLPHPELVPRHDGVFAPRRPFLSQKRRVKRRLVLLAAAAAVLGLAVLSILIAGGRGS